MELHRFRPFFLFASWVGPHPPYYVPQKYLDEYAGTAIPQPCESTIWSRRQVPVSPENPDRDGKRMHAIQESYYAAITFIDFQIGRVLDALDRLNLRDNTLIIFTTDHGEMLGDLGAYQKHVPYEGSAHIPLVVSGADFTADARSAVPVTTWDTAATILKTSGVTPPHTHPLVGESLSNLVGTAGDRTIVFHHGESQHRYVASTDGRYKFIHWYNGGQEELFDLADDPWEQHNLIAQSSISVNALRSACQNFEIQHGQAERVRDGSFVDLKYIEPERHSASLYPEWSSYQFPPWTEHYAADDLQLIAGEMKDCLKSEFACICKEPEWRQHALREWEKIGGNRQIYQDLFDRADEKC